MRKQLIYTLLFVPFIIQAEVDDLSQKVNEVLISKPDCLFKLKEHKFTGCEKIPKKDKVIIELDKRKGRSAVNVSHQKAEMGMIEKATSSIKYASGKKGSALETEVQKIELKVGKGENPHKISCIVVDYPNCGYLKLKDCESDSLVFVSDSGNSYGGVNFYNPSLSEGNASCQNSGVTNLHRGTQKRIRAQQNKLNPEYPAGKDFIQ